ncbi:MAG TPA: carboxypeptidase regulatory-like domain-containing protein [Pyrinomonadaceae bacterium]|nr:carboxypeptidase regulatory-like domain-containing protein [Pyrinomonadaceae bacterium]
MRSLTQGLLLAFFFLAVGVAPAFAQASSSTAEVRGQVTDSAGAAIPNATLTLTDIGKGTIRTTTTDADGNYVFLNLLPSSYDLKIEAASGGFAAALQRVELTVGQQANIPVQLGVGGITEKVEIVAGMEVVDTDRTQQSSVVDVRQITNLPISRRNYLDYALLTPGVSDADNIADSSDFRVAQTPNSGLSFGGNNGRGNLIAVDGGSTNTVSGGVEQTTNQEAVQEFQVLRNSYNAEFGGASGGIVNIVTKSGANRYSGSLFGLFRHERFDARNPFDFNPSGKSPFSRQQFGGSIGGPIKQDKSFFFAALERFSQDETTFVNLLNSASIFQITPSQATLFDALVGTPFAPLAVALRSTLTTTSANFPRTINLFNSASGQFPFESSQTTFSTRFDHNFSQRDTAYIRFNLNKSSFENQAAGALTAVSRGRTLDTFNGGILLSENHQFSDSTVNEFKVQYRYYDFDVIPNDPIGPEFNIEGFGFFGRDIFLPSGTIQRDYDIIDNLSHVTGNHTLKFGGSFLASDVSSNNDTFFGGRFNFGPNIPLQNLIPAATLTSLRAFLTANNPALLTNLATPINALQSFNLNLPIVYQQGFGRPAVDSFTYRYALYGQDTWKVRPNFTLTYGLRYSISDEPFYMPLDKNDFQPRLGFSWDPFRDGKTVIRGGAGLFAGYTIYSVPNVTKTLSGIPDDNINIVLATATSAALGVPSSFTIYQTLLAQGVIGTRTITAADLTQFGITPRPGAPLEVRFRAEPNYETPTTYQASAGIQRDLGYGTSVELSYLFTRGLHLTRNRDVNQFKASLVVTGTTNPCFFRLGATIPATCTGTVPATSDFLNPLRFQDNIYESSANSFYHAGTISVQRRFANNFSLNAHYTFAKSIDEVTDFNSDFSAQNPLNLRRDRALSSFDQRHRAVFSGVFASGVKGDSIGDKLLRDWVISPIFTAGSGRPFNLLLGFDANNDGRSQSDRPFDAGRNTGVGEPFYSFDARIARRFPFKETMFLELTFEAFNIFNRTNLAGINNVVGSLSSDQRRVLSTTRAHGNRAAAPTEPLGFTSAANPRQLQFGVRFNF